MIKNIGLVTLAIIGIVYFTEISFDFFRYMKNRGDVIMTTAKHLTIDIDYSKKSVGERLYTCWAVINGKTFTFHGEE